MTAATTAERPLANNPHARRMRQTEAARATAKQPRKFLPEAVAKARGILERHLSNGVHAQLMTIDSVMALVMLDRNTANRDFKWGSVVRYKGFLERNEWLLTGDTICFSELKVLVDGQNRLESVLQTGIPMRTWVVFGVDRNAFKVKDTGERRKASDVITIMGTANAHQIAPALRQLGQYLADDWSFKDTITIFEIEELLRQHPNIRQSNAVGQGVKRFIRSIPATPYTVCHYLFSQTDAAMADAFFEKLKLGLDARKGDPEYVLRELFTQEAPLFRAKTPEVYRAIIRAWNARRKDKGVTRHHLLHGSAGDASFPEPI